jgi:predicted GIY-YIG superfamily endonuclease
MNWSVYLLSCGRRTYVGSTTNPERRLRQHNREIVGGARATRVHAPNWKIVLYVTGFPNRSSACRWEKLIKGRARGVRDRSIALLDLLEGKCPPGRTWYEPPMGLTVHYVGETK